MSDPIITDAAREAADKEVQAFLSCRNPYVQGHHVQQLLTSEVDTATKALREERDEETARAFRLRMRAEHAEDRLATRGCAQLAATIAQAPRPALNMSDEEIEERARAGMERMGFTLSPAPATETEIDTPLTDAARFYMDHTDEELVAADFARDLERELAAAKKERDEAHIFIPCFSCLGTGEGKHDRACSTCGGRKVIKKRAGELQQALDTAIAERDKARKDSDVWEGSAERFRDECAAIVRQRDTALRELAEARSACAGLRTVIESRFQYEELSSMDRAALERARATLDSALSREA